MNKKLYLILFLGLLALGFYPYNKSYFVVSANKKLANDTVRTLAKSDIMGEYAIYGTYNFCKLNLYKDTFNSVSGACTYEIKESGKWDFQNNTLYFSGVCSEGEDCMFSYFSKKDSQEEYAVIRQDSFLILINKSWSNKYLSKVYQEICKLQNSGLNATYSTFLHKKLENHAPILIPTIPAEYHKFLLKKPITCKIIAIENDTTITINAGKKDGIFKGLQLYKKTELEKEKKRERKKYIEGDYLPSFFTFEVVACEAHTATLKPIEKLAFGDIIVGKAKKLQIGNTLHSKREKKSL